MQIKVLTRNFWHLLIYFCKFNLVFWLRKCGAFNPAQRKAAQRYLQA
jgi:hypothetical protein